MGRGVTPTSRGRVGRRYRRGRSPRATRLTYDTYFSRGAQPRVVNRRTLLRGAAGAAVVTGLAGCLTSVQRAVAGDIRASSAMATLHPPSRPVLAAPYRLTDGSYRAWLVTDPPDEDLIAADLPAAERSELRQRVADADYESGFLLVVEVRSRIESRVQVGPTVRHDARWTGLGSAELPVRLSDARDVDDPSFEGETHLVSTGFIEFEAGRAPRRASVAVYAEDGSQLATVDAAPLAP